MSAEQQEKLQRKLALLRARTAPAPDPEPITATAAMLQGLSDSESADVQRKLDLLRARAQAKAQPAPVPEPVRKIAPPPVDLKPEKPPVPEPVRKIAPPPIELKPEKPPVPEPVRKIAPAPIELKPEKPPVPEPVRKTAPAPVKQAVATPEHADTRGRRLGSLVFNVAFYAVLLAILGSAILFAVSNNPRKSYLGYRLYTVKTPSMAPQQGGPKGGFRVGDTLLVKLCKPESIQTGDVVTFVPGNDPNVYLTHRVVKVLDHLNEAKGLFLVTRGDANPSDDPPIAASAVIGKVVTVIPKAGSVIEFIRANLLLCLVIVVSGTGSIVLMRMFFSKSDMETRAGGERRPVLVGG